MGARRSHPVSTALAFAGLAENFEEPDGYGVISLLGSVARPPFPGAAQLFHVRTMNLYWLQEI